MDQQPLTVNRTMVGIIGAVLLAVAGVLMLTQAEGKSEMWAGACLKVGLVMTAFWLALPAFSRSENLGKASLTTVAVVLAGGLIVARTRVPLNVILPSLGVAVVLLRVLRPWAPASNRPRRDF